MMEVHLARSCYFDMIPRHVELHSFLSFCFKRLNLLIRQFRIRRYVYIQVLSIERDPAVFNTIDWLKYLAYKLPVRIIIKESKIIRQVRVAVGVAHISIMAISLYLLVI